MTITSFVMSAGIDGDIKQIKLVNAAAICRVLLHPR